MPKCIETSCNNKGTKILITYDDQKIYVCETHLSAWLESGAVLKPALSKTILKTLRRYGIVSSIFLTGLSLTIYDVYINHQTSITSIPSFTGLMLLLISWLIFCSTIKSAYSKIKETKTLKV